MNQKPNSSFFPQIGKDLHQFEFSNGFRSLYHQRPEILYTESCLLFSVDDTFKGKTQGLAHIAEHLTARYLKEQLASWGEKCELTARTDFDTISFSYAATNEAFTDVLRTFKGVFELAPHIQADRESFEDEMRVVLAELKYIDQDVHSLIKAKGMELLYGNTPYGVGDPAGRIEDVKTVLLEQVISYFNSVFNPSNSVLAVSGYHGEPTVFINIVSEQLGFQYCTDC